MAYNYPIRYRAEWLPNGFIRCYDARTQMTTLFNAGGTVRHGYPSEAERDYVHYWRHGMTR